MTLVVSPHLDDAVLSVGQTIAADPDVRVLTVFAGVPYSGLSDYDKACKFSTSTEAMLVRRSEDVAASLILGYKPIHADLFDRQYRTSEDEHGFDSGFIASITDTVNHCEPDWEFEHVLVPLGLEHPDHVDVALGVIDACPTGGGELIIYEELPYKVLRPELVAPALQRFRDRGFEIFPNSLPTGDVALKRRALSAYRSQFPTPPDDPMFYVPERCWRALRQ